MVKNNSSIKMREVKKGCKIIQIGNSQGVLIDKNSLEYLGLDIGDWVEVIVKKADTKEVKDTQKKDKKN